MKVVRCVTIHIYIILWIWTYMKAERARSLVFLVLYSPFELQIKKDRWFQVTSDFPLTSLNALSLLFDFLLSLFQFEPRLFASAPKHPVSTFIHLLLQFSLSLFLYACFFFFISTLIWMTTIRNKYQVHSLALLFLSSVCLTHVPSNWANLSSASAVQNKLAEVRTCFSFSLLMR